MNKRSLRPFEQGAHLHVLDWAHDTARQRFEAAGRAQVRAASASFIAASAPAPGPPRLPSLEAALYDVLRTLHGLGYGTVRSELDHQRSGRPIPIGLSTAIYGENDIFTLAVVEFPGDSGPLRQRAILAAQAAAHSIWQAVHRGRLQNLTPSRRRELGEEAGLASLRGGASLHTGAVLNAGRRAAISQEVIGARYTSILDQNTCSPCAAADDGELHALDDPALAPAPNPACEGGDRCRCIHVYQLASETSSLPVAIAAGG